MTAHVWIIQLVLLYSVLLADYWILLVQFCDAQVVVDHLKRYDKDGKGALSREELQEAIRGADGADGAVCDVCGVRCGSSVVWIFRVPFEFRTGHCHEGQLQVGRVARCRAQ